MKAFLETCWSGFVADDDKLTTYSLPKKLANGCYDKGILIMDEDEEAQEAQEAKVSFNSDGYITGVSASWNYNEDGDSYKVAVRFHFHTTETVS